MTPLPRPSLTGGMRRLLLTASLVVLLTLVVAATAILGSIRLLDSGADEAAVADARRLNEVMLVAVVALGLLAIGIGWYVWRIVLRQVTVPLAQLAVEVRQAARVGHEHEIPQVGYWEIAALSRDVEHMRRELVDQVSEARAAQALADEAHALLREQAEELERSNRDLEQFAYVASHDLQEPLRKVASFSQLLQKRYGGQLDARADQYIEFAVDGAHRMQRLIQDLLSFSRVGRADREHEDVLLAEVVEHVEHELSERIAELDAQVTYDGLPVVHGERGLLTMLVRNVMSNALKFTRDGVRPTVHLSAREVTERGVTSWEISCADNGIGIDPVYADRVFVIFQRLHPKEHYTGTGIGLALVKRVVEHHGGTVWVDTEVAEGTTVRWTIPTGT